MVRTIHSHTLNAYIGEAPRTINNTPYPSAQVLQLIWSVLCRIQNCIYYAMTQAKILRNTPPKRNRTTSNASNRSQKMLSLNYYASPKHPRTHRYAESPDATHKSTHLPTRPSTCQILHQHPKILPATPPGSPSKRAYGDPESANRLELTPDREMA